MDGQRWWIIDEIARWWREADETARFVLMQRAREGTKEATVEEVTIGAIRAEISCNEAEQANEAIERWSLGKGFGRR